MRIERERPPEQSLPTSVMTEAELDHARVEDLDRVARPQPQGADRVALGLVAAPILVERPGENVLRGDAFLRPVREAGARERIGEAPAVVEIEERGLELGADAGRL